MDKKRNPEGSMERKSPKIRETTADTVLENIQKKAPFYVPEWTPGAEGDFGNALSRIFADMAENLVSNLNEAPRKHLLSFLDKLNFSLNPAKPASTVLFFVPGSKAPGNVNIPAKTRVTAKSSDGENIFFETEKTIAITPSKLCLICSLDRERDAIFDHSSTIEGNEPSVLLSGTNRQKHAFYIGDEELFRSGKGKISFAITTAGAVPARVLAEENMFIWEYAAPASGEEEEKTEIAEWLPFSASRYSGGKFEILKGEEIIGSGKIYGLESRWIRCRLKGERIGELEQFVLGPVKADVSAEGIKPDFLFYNDIPLEEDENGVQPFGSKPILYDTFYIACSEAFSRQGSEVQMDFYLKPGRTGLISEKPVLSWEYWSGESWRSLKRYMDFGVDLGESEEGKSGSEKLPELELENFLIRNIIETEAEKEPNGTGRFFRLKEKMDRKEEEENPLLVHVNVKIREMPSMMSGNINGEENYWIRVRLIEGNFGKEYVISKKKPRIPVPGKFYPPEIVPGKFYPPEIRKLILSYSNKNGREPDYLVSENNLAFENEKEKLKQTGCLKPFETLSEPLPAVYLGFTSKLMKGNLSLFIKLEETFVDQGVPVKFEWQYLADSGKDRKGEWKELQVRDETEGLAKSGVLEFFVPGEMKILQCYGSKNPLYWIRLLFTEGKRTPQISGFYPNCVRALQAKTTQDEILGSGFGETGQELELRNRPVVDAEVWVDELAWLSEGDKQALLNKNEGRDVEIKKDSDGRFSEFWVRWEKVEDFGSSDEKNRHYLLDRTSGIIRFGDAIRGMIPPIGSNNIKASYRTGGGEAGNLEAFSITKFYSALKNVDAVYNPAASEGGTRTESLEELVARAPATFKHRGRAVSKEDIIQLTKEASQKVAKVNVLSGSDEEENRVPGLMTVVIVPDLQDPKPVPTPEIVQIVEADLKKKTPNIGKLKVAGPVYHQVNVRAELVTTNLEAVSEIETRVKRRIEEFLHPLTGGTEGKGWDFGPTLSTSDFYSLLSDISGVSYVKDLKITSKARDETPEKPPEPSGRLILPISTLPCSGKHEIKVFWKAEREE
jgi:hypothetical protein